MIYFISRLFFGLDFLNKIFLFASALLRVWFNYIIYIAAFLRSWFSQQKYLFDRPRCAYDLIIYFISRLFFGLDILNKRYVFAFVLLCVWFIYIIYISAFLPSWFSQLKYLFDRPPRVYDLIIFFISRLFFAIDFLNKRYSFASALL